MLRRSQAARTASLIVAQSDDVIGLGPAAAGQVKSRALFMVVQYYRPESRVLTPGKPIVLCVHPPPAKASVKRHPELPPRRHEELPPPSVS